MAVPSGLFGHLDRHIQVGDGRGCEEGKVAVAGQGANLIGGAVSDDGAGFHEHDALGEVLCFFQVVRRKKNGRSTFGDGFHTLPEGAARIHVHAGGRLVQDQQFRRVHGRQGVTQTLLLTARALTDLTLSDIGQVSAGEYLIHINGLGVQRRNHLDRSADRQVLEQATGLLNRTEQTGACRLGGVTAKDAQLAAAGLGQTKNHVDEGGLACTVGAEQGDDFAALDGQVNRVDGDHGACRTGGENLAEGAGRNNGFCGVVLAVLKCCGVHVSITPPVFAPLRYRVS